MGIWQTVVETHTLRDAGGKGGYVKLDGKPVSWLLDEDGHAAPYTASSCRKEMNERSLGLCMLDHEQGLRTTAWAKIAIWTRSPKAYT